MRACSPSSPIPAFTWAFALGLTLVGCGDDGAPAVNLPYGSETVVIGPNGETTHATPTGEDCVELPGGDCVKPQGLCGSGARADVIVDADGQLVTVVCYPNAADDVTVTAEDKLKTEESNVVIAIDGIDDGPDIANNVEFKGDDVVVYGEGTDVSVLAGNLKLSGDRAVVRSIRVDGNLEVDGAEASIIDCVVGGNLHIKRAGNLVADCTVFGDLHADMGDNNLIGNLVGKDFKAQAASNTCSGNQAFDDANSDLVVAGEELGAVLDCPTK